MFVPTCGHRVDVPQHLSTPPSPRQRPPGNFNIQLSHCIFMKARAGDVWIKGTSMNIPCAPFDIHCSFNGLWIWVANILSWMKQSSPWLSVWFVSDFLSCHLSSEVGSCAETEIRDLVICIFCGIWHLLGGSYCRGHRFQNVATTKYPRKPNKFCNYWIIPKPGSHCAVKNLLVTILPHI